jgi:hypothetical protein
LGLRKIARRTDVLKLFGNFEPAAFEFVNLGREFAVAF